MADTETEEATKPKSTAKAKAKPKAKAKAKPKVKTTAKAKPKVKPKAETTSKANTADVAPYLSKDNKIEPPQAQASKHKPFTTLLLISVIAIVVIITTYKLNIEISELSARDDTQVNAMAVVAAPVAAPAAAPIAEKQAEPTNFKEDAAVVETPEQVAPPTNQAPVEQSRSQTITQTHSAKHDETMQQRRQVFEKRMQLKKQEFKAIVEAHKKERAKLAAEQNNVMLRIKQKNQETKLKVDEIRKQIYELHQEINQIMRESSQVQRQP